MTTMFDHRLRFLCYSRVKGCNHVIYTPSHIQEEPPHRIRRHDLPTRFDEETSTQYDDESDDSVNDFHWSARGTRMCMTGTGQVFILVSASKKLPRFRGGKSSEENPQAEVTGGSL